MSRYRSSVRLRYVMYIHYVARHMQTPDLICDGQVSTTFRSYRYGICKGIRYLWTLVCVLMERSDGSDAELFTCLYCVAHHEVCASHLVWTFSSRNSQAVLPHWISHLSKCWVVPLPQICLWWFSITIKKHSYYTTLNIPSLSHIWAILNYVSQLTYQRSLDQTFDHNFLVVKAAWGHCLI